MRFRLSCLTYDRRGGPGGKTETSVEKTIELERRFGLIENVLREAGLKHGQVVLEFGCGSGNYTVPCARIVGPDGMVYAIDKDESVLRELTRRLKTLELASVRVIKAFVHSAMPLESDSADVALLSDVIHSYYFDSDGRKRILREVNRILKSGGSLVFYPGDPEVFSNPSELKAVKREIEEEGFRLEGERCGAIIHEDFLTEGCVSRYAEGVADPQVGNPPVRMASPRR